MADIECQNLLNTFLEGAYPHRGSSILVTMVTLDNRAIATYTRTRLYYFNEKKIPNGPELPARFQTDPHPGEFAGGVSKGDWGQRAQLFSNRLGGQPTPPGATQTEYQRFDKDQADDITMEMTVTPVSRVKITYRSQGNAVVTFDAKCSDGGFPIGIGEPRNGGFLIGETPFAKYVLFVCRFGRDPDA